MQTEFNFKLITQFIPMNILKKVLTKDGMKSYQLNSKHGSMHMTAVKDKSHNNRNDWTKIDNVIECVTFFTYSENHPP